MEAFAASNGSGSAPLTPVDHCHPDQLPCNRDGHKSADTHYAELVEILHASVSQGAVVVTVPPEPRLSDYQKRLGARRPSPVDIDLTEGAGDDNRLSMTPTPVSLSPFKHCHPDQRGCNGKSASVHQTELTMALREAVACGSVVMTYSPGGCSKGASNDEDYADYATGVGMESIASGDAISTTSFCEAPYWLREVHAAACLEDHRDGLEARTTSDDVDEEEEEAACGSPCKAGRRIAVFDREASTSCSGRQPPAALAAEYQVTHHSAVACATLSIPTPVAIVCEDAAVTAPQATPMATAAEQGQGQGQEHAAAQVIKCWEVTTPQHARDRRTYNACMGLMMQQQEAVNNERLSAAGHDTPAPAVRAAGKVASEGGRGREAPFKGARQIKAGLKPLPPRVKPRSPRNLRQLRSSRRSTTTPGEGTSSKCLGGGGGGGARGTAQAAREEREEARHVPHGLAWLGCALKPATAPAAAAGGGGGAAAGLKPLPDAPPPCAPSDAPRSVHSKASARPEATAAAARAESLGAQRQDARWLQYVQQPLRLQLQRAGWLKDERMRVPPPGMRGVPQAQSARASAAATPLSLSKPGRRLARAPSPALAACNKFVGGGGEDAAACRGFSPSTPLGLRLLPLL